MTKAYLGDFRLCSVHNIHGGGGKVALLWLLLQYKARQTCIKARDLSLRRAAAGAAEDGVGRVGRELEQRQLWL